MFSPQICEAIPDSSSYSPLINYRPSIRHRREYVTSWLLDHAWFSHLLATHWLCIVIIMIVIQITVEREPVTRQRSILTSDYEYERKVTIDTSNNLPSSFSIVIIAMLGAHSCPESESNSTWNLSVSSKLMSFTIDIFKMATIWWRPNSTARDVTLTKSGLVPFETAVMSCVLTAENGFDVHGVRL